VNGGGVEEMRVRKGNQEEKDQKLVVPRLTEDPRETGGQEKKQLKKGPRKV